MESAIGKSSGNVGYNRNLWRAVRERINNSFEHKIFFVQNELLVVDIKHVFVQHQLIFVDTRLLFVQHQSLLFDAKLFFV